MIHHIPLPLDNALFGPSLSFIIHTPSYARPVDLLRQAISYLDRCADYTRKHRPIWMDALCFESLAKPATTTTTTTADSAKGQRREQLRESRLTHQLQRAARKHGDEPTYWSTTATGDISHQSCQPYLPEKTSQHLQFRHITAWTGGKKPRDFPDEDCDDGGDRAEDVSNVIDD